MRTHYMDLRGLASLLVSCTRYVATENCSKMAQDLSHADVEKALGAIQYLSKLQMPSTGSVGATGSSASAIPGPSRSTDAEIDGKGTNYLLFNILSLM